MRSCLRLPGVRMRSGFARSLLSTQILLIGNSIGSAANPPASLLRTCTVSHVLCSGTCGRPTNAEIRFTHEDICSEEQALPGCKYSLCTKRTFLGLLPQKESRAVRFDLSRQKIARCSQIHYLHPGVQNFSLHCLKLAQCAVSLDTMCNQCRKVFTILWCIRSRTEHSSSKPLAAGCQTI